MNEQAFVRELLFGETRRLCRVDRYNSTPVLRKENVAEHSWYVAWMCLNIYHTLKSSDPDIARADVGILLTKALVHDLDEMLTGDIPRFFKYYNDRIKREINQASKDVFTEYANRTELPNAIYDSVLECKVGVEGEIVALADLLTVVSYVREEIMMGNQLIAQKAGEVQKNLAQYKSKFKNAGLARYATIAMELSEEVWQANK